MTTVTVSPEYQVVIPQAEREALGIRPGQKIEVIAYEGRLELIPVSKPGEMRGFLRGIETSVPRDLERGVNLVDSSGWLEYLADDANADFFAPPIEDVGHLIVPTISLLTFLDKTFLPDYPQCELRMARFRGVDETEFLDQLSSLSPWH